MKIKSHSLQWIAGLVLMLIASVLVLSRANVFASDGASQLAPASGELTVEEQIAQDIAMSDSEVAKLLDGNRSEVFHILSISDQFANCADGKCMQANIYDYDAKATISVVVDVSSQQVVDVFNLPGAQPPILNVRLDNLARETIASSQEVKEALGFAPNPDEILMMQANHLDSENCREANVCAAAVFLVDGGVVWVMYDGTEEQIDKIWWDNRPPSIEDKNVFRAQPSEEFLANVPQDCNSSLSVNQDGWTMTYETTNTDSLRVSNIRFNGDLVMTAASLVEWHADYGGWGYRDSTGCADVGGSNGFMIYPYGNSDVVSLFEGGNRVGFEIIQDFRMTNWGNSCNYRYEQHFQFYTDGRWRVVGGAFGEGCGDNQSGEAIYRPVWRYDIAVDDSANDAIQTWDGGAWQTVGSEAWFLQGNQNTTADGYMYRIYDTVSETGYFIEPGQGQFNDAGTGDNAYLYVTRFNLSEGAADITLLPNTSCCDDDHRQGPDEFVNGQSTNGQDLVLWYVPQSETITLWEANNTGADEYCWTESRIEGNYWPCWSGPMFVPDNTVPTAIGLDSAEIAPPQLAPTPNLLLTTLTLSLITISGFAIFKRHNA